MDYSDDACSDNFTNGQVKIGAGDFTFFVKSGTLIENGKLTQPIKDINIIGNGPQALCIHRRTGRTVPAHRSIPAEAGSLG